jgi:hypothetical protein
VSVLACHSFGPDMAHTYLSLKFVLEIVDVSTSYVAPDQLAFHPSVFGYAALFVSLFSNMRATSLIGYKAWYAMRFYLALVARHSILGRCDLRLI